MKPLPANVSDEQLLEFVDQWAALLAQEDYDAAFAFTDHEEQFRWSADMIRASIKDYDEADPEQTVTVEGVPAHIAQRKSIRRHGESQPLFWRNLV